MSDQKYIITLSCQDQGGIVAAVSGCLADMQGFILESSQYGDPSTKQFFMRILFAVHREIAENEIALKFAPIAERFAMTWQLHNQTYRPKVLILVSKLSHCLNDILYRWSADKLAIDIPLIVSNHPDLEKMAKWHGIPFLHFPMTKETKDTQEVRILELVWKHAIDLVVLARYMQILTPKLCNFLKGRAINIHHSFLPSFKGAKPYHQAYDRGVKIIGASAHYVTADLDEGPIIEQEITHVNHSHSPTDLVRIGCDIENRVLAQAISYHIEQRVILNKNKTVVFS